MKEQSIVYPRCDSSFNENDHVCYYIKMMMGELTIGSIRWRQLLSSYNKFSCSEELVCNHVDKEDLSKTVGRITCPNKPDGPPDGPPPQVNCNMHNIKQYITIMLTKSIITEA